jgi:hypothetical protein
VIKIKYEILSGKLKNMDKYWIEVRLKRDNTVLYYQTVDTKEQLKEAQAELAKEWKTKKVSDYEHKKTYLAKNYLKAYGIAKLSRRLKPWTFDEICFVAAIYEEKGSVETARLVGRRPDVVRRKMMWAKRRGTFEKYRAIGLGEIKFDHELYRFFSGERGSEEAKGAAKRAKKKKGGEKDGN